MGFQLEVKLLPKKKKVETADLQVILQHNIGLADIYEISVGEHLKAN